MICSFSYPNQKAIEEYTIIEAAITKAGGEIVSYEESYLGLFLEIESDNPDDFYDRYCDIDKSHDHMTYYREYTKEEYLNDDLIKQLLSNID